MKKYAMNLTLFAEGGAAPAGGGADAGTAAESAPVAVNIGDTMNDGSTVADAQVAAAMNRQLKRHPEMRERYFGQVQPAQEQAEQQATQEDQNAAGNTAEDRWNELKKGEYREQYGRDVQNAVRERFKNQEDARQKLESMQPMLAALMKKQGVDSVEALQESILNDDSLYEEEAEEAGMTVEGFRMYKQMEDENKRIKAQEEQQRNDAILRQHVAGLVQQADELKKTFPNFDLREELQNETFRDLVKPGSKIGLADAYFAIHREDLQKQLLGYGMQRAQQQMGQTIAAQGMRPQEGAMSSRNAAAAEPKINPKNLSKEERKAYKDLARKGTYVSFDR